MNSASNRTVRTIVVLITIAVAASAFWWMHSASGLESRFYKLYTLNQSRGPVTHSGFAYYPANKELRVRVIVGERIEAWGIYTDPDTVENLLHLLRGDPEGLFCVFDNNELIALYRE